MFFIAKTFIYFTLSFIILSIPINDKKLYYHLDNLAAPFTTLAFEKMSEAAIEGKELVVKTFTNSSKKRVDKIRSSSFSANVKKRMIKNEIYKIKKSKSSDDSYTFEEEQLLNKIIEQEE